MCVNNPRGWQLYYGQAPIRVPEQKPKKPKITMLKLKRYAELTKIKTK